MVLLLLFSQKLGGSKVFQSSGSVMKTLFKVRVQAYFKALSLAALSAGLLYLPPGLASVSRAAAVPETGSNTLLAQQSGVETVLYFETPSLAVRIYRRGTALFMNLYNRKTDTTEVRDTPAELVSSSQDGTVYTNSLGEVNRFARISVLGEAELEIVGPDDKVILQESGSNAVVGVPSGATDFRGNNFAPGLSARVLASRYANLRQQPDAASTTITTVPRQDVVDVLDRVGNPRDGFIWYKVSYQGKTGWVRGDLLQAN